MSKRRRKHRKRPRTAPDVTTPPRRPRLRWIVGIALGLVIVIAAAGVWRARQAPALDPIPGGAPSLLVTPASIDLGDVRLDRWVSAPVQVSNIGTGTLRFDAPPWVSVVAGC